MAIYRNVQMSFWTDAKIVDNFTPEDRYFYLYLITNPHTNLCGCYEISIKQISVETGYTEDKILNLIDRFEHIFDTIRYNFDTKECLIAHWPKYNWTKSNKFILALNKEIQSVKDVEFRRFLEDTLAEKDTVSIPYTYGMDTTVTVTVTDTVYKNNRKGGVGGKQKTPTPSELKSEFSELWKLYPKKQGKDRAYGYYERSRKDGTTYEEVEQGINAYVEYIKANQIDIKYVKQGSTFFSQKSWMDDWTIRSKPSQSTSKGSRRELFARLYEEHKDDEV